MLSENTRRWVEKASRGRVIGVSVVRGSTSSRLHDIEIRDDAGRRHLILRRFTDEEWVRREPDVAVREGASLQHAVRADLPVPTLIAVDAAGEHCGVPATLVTRVPGKVIIDPDDLGE